MFLFASSFSVLQNVVNHNARKYKYFISEQTFALLYIMSLSQTAHNNWCLSPYILHAKSRGQQKKEYANVQLFECLICDNRSQFS
jgi:hypothetical protein